MEQKNEIFQYALMAIFGLLTVGAVIVFATYSGSAKVETGPISIWGTLPDETVQNVIDGLIRDKVTGLDGVTYTQLDSRYYYQVLVEGIATGQGPDLILIDHDALVSHWNKLWVIPYENYPQQAFKQAFAEGTEIFLGNTGVIAVPFLIDPLVMYWNRDHFTNSGISQPPKFWNEFYDLAPRLTKIDNDLNVLQSAISFGEVSNVTHAKEILSTLIMQAGSPIISFGPDGLSSHLDESFGKVELPAVSALRFYTEFSNPVKSVYSWNRALEQSRDAFIAGDLSVYFGYASEAVELQRQNPNLNFDVAPIPQTPDGDRRITYAKFTGLAIPNAARNKAGALYVANVFSGPQAQAAFSQALNLPPIRRDMLAQPQTTVFWTTAYDSALIAKAWHDPSPYYTKTIFDTMVESVSSGARSVIQSVTQASKELRNMVQ